jgi:hypothetical protein
MDGLTPDRVSGRRGRHGAGRKARTHTAPDGHALNDPAALAEPGVAHGTLDRAVQREVIPRLMVAHRSRLATDGSAARHDDESIGRFSALLRSRDLPAALALVDQQRAAGASIESVMLDLLVPAAHHLSACWEADVCRYEEIAVGMLHLQQVLHGLSAEFASERQASPCGRKVLLLSAPSEQAMLGVFMVTEFHRCIASEFFHHAGWDVWRAPPTSRTQLLGLLRMQWFDVIDVSASCAERLPQLLADLQDMRHASRNTRVGVVVGGPAFGDDPALAARLGADACAMDPRDMLVQAEALVSQRDRPQPRPPR